MNRKFPRSEITNNLARLRKGRSVSALAAEVGVSRQAIHAIEAGTYVPNTALSLRLAKTLGVKVEELFRLNDSSTDQSRKPLTANLIPSRSQLWPGETVQLCQVDGRLMAAQPAPLEWYLPATDAVADSKPIAGKVRVRPHQLEVGFDDRIIIAGCDPAMALVAGHLKTAGIQAVLVHENSSKSLFLLKRRCVHVAGIHLSTPATGEANIAAVNRDFSRNSVAVFSFAAWQEGLITAAGNPKHIKRVEDLAWKRKIRFVNREPGAATRVLLDSTLARLHMQPNQIHGYDHQTPAHLTAALQVKTGAADCCIATEAAARVFGLNFIPLASARYDLVIRRSHLKLNAIRTLLDMIAQAAFRRDLHAVAGYDTSVTCTRVL